MGVSVRVWACAGNAAGLGRHGHGQCLGAAGPLHRAGRVHGRTECICGRTFCRLAKLLAEPCIVGKNAGEWLPLTSCTSAQELAERHREAHDEVMGTGSHDIDSSAANAARRRPGTPASWRCRPRSSPWAWRTTISCTLATWRCCLCSWPPRAPRWSQQPPVPSCLRCR